MPEVPFELTAVERELERRQRERARIEAEPLRASLPAFIHAAWPMLEPATKFKPNWHIDVIAEHLEAARRGEIRRLIVNVPPRHMKSLNVSVLWPVWWWCSDPTVRFLTASYGADLAIRDSLKSRRLIQTNWFQHRFGDVFWLTSDQNVKGRYENNRSGYRIATSVGGTATGEGGDVILIDDPHKADEVESDIQRQDVLDWHDGTISTRFNDPNSAIEVLVMQRLHEQDLTGHLLERGGWTHLCLPAEYEPLGDTTDEEYFATFREQAEALAEGGVDLFAVETMMFPQEATAAIRACKAVTDLPVMATMFFQYEDLHDRDRTMWGESPAEVAKNLLAAGADVVGMNCGRGPDRAIAIIREMRTVTGAPLVAYPNAGLPITSGDHVTYELGPEAMVRDYPALLDAGCSIVGACCGSTPEHIRLISEVVRARKSR